MLQCPLSPRLSRPLSYLFLSCPQFSPSFSFQNPLCSYCYLLIQVFSPHSFEPFVTAPCLSQVPLSFYSCSLFSRMCVMVSDTLCAKRIVVNMSDVLSHSSCHRCCVGSDDQHADVDFKLLESHRCSHFHLHFLLLTVLVTQLQDNCQKCYRQSRGCALIIGQIIHFCWPDKNVLTDKYVW